LILEHRYFGEPQPGSGGNLGKACGRIADIVYNRYPNSRRFTWTDLEDEANQE
jgi:hypothetical protein